ncbi:putative nucleoredoxin 1 [Bienertia sinuspersici]
MDARNEIVEPVKKDKKKIKKVSMQVKTKLQEILRKLMQSKEKQILWECMWWNKQILRKLIRSKKKEILRELMQWKKKQILRELMQSKKKEIPKLKKKKEEEDEIPGELEGKFEMVIVAKMRPGWTHDKDAFTSFLDGFPPNCLAIPFRAKSHRHHACKSLGGIHSTLLVDPDQTVLIYKPVSSDDVDDTSFVPLYGANSTPFPFVSRKVTNIPTIAMRNLKTPSSLEDFLCCKTSDIVSRKILLGDGTFHQENVSISELKTKLVGLYLFTSGHMIAMLPKISQACLQHGKELEIVLVYSLGEHVTENPQSAEQDLLNVLAKRNLPWWVAPYNSTASIVLDHMFDLGERVFILGPNGLFVEPHEAELMQMFGFYAYPFRFDSVVRKIWEELRQVSLESFLKLLEIQELPRKKKKLAFQQV